MLITRDVPSMNPDNGVFSLSRTDMRRAGVTARRNRSGRHHSNSGPHSVIANDYVLKMSLVHSVNAKGWYCLVPPALPGSHQRFFQRNIFSVRESEFCEATRVKNSCDLSFSANTRAAVPPIGSDRAGPINPYFINRTTEQFHRDGLVHRPNQNLLPFIELRIQLPNPVYV